MLNRTLSAKSNGLNLGTRTLANLAGLNIVATQGLRHDHPRKRKDSMRGGDAKLMRDSSISIRGSLEIPPSPCSPTSSPAWPYRAEASPARPEVVVAVPSVAVERSVSALLAERASRTGGSQAQFQQGFRFRSWQQAAMTRTESIPVASTATGG